jgi:ASC-1-like (ASCH) protein
MKTSIGFNITLLVIFTVVVLALVIPVINREPPIDRTLTDLSTIELAVRAYHSEYNSWPQATMRKPFEN